MLPRVRWQKRTTTMKPSGMEFRKATQGRDIGPTCRFTASPEVCPGAIAGTLQTGYPRIQDLSQDRARHAFTHHHMAHSSRSCLPVWDGLQCCCVSCSTEPCRPTRESSDAATCLIVPDPTSRLGKALVQPRVPQFWTLPPG
jgi:hypothetical protein